jgi:hypothetical protein
MSMAGYLSGFSRHSYYMNRIGYSTVIDAVFFETMCESHREYANHGVEKWVGLDGGSQAETTSFLGLVSAISTVRWRNVAEPSLLFITMEALLKINFVQQNFFGRGLDISKALLAPP